MATRPRTRNKGNWPDNLYEPRPGYYTWRDPRSGKTHVIGRVPLAVAKFQAIEANAHIVAPSKSLIDRLQTAGQTVSDLLEKMPTEGIAENTLRSRRSLDITIRERLGAIDCGALTVKHIAELLETFRDAGKARSAQALRSRMVSMCRRGVELGWLQSNLAEVTGSPEVKVKRRRLNGIDEFNAILKVAPQVNEWLANVMLLALVSGQDRVTIAEWQRPASTATSVLLRRGKTGVKIEVPLELRLDALGMSLGEVVTRCKSSRIATKYLIHHVRPYGNAPTGSPVHPDSISHAFADARALAGIMGDDAPAFHEIRSLAKRLYSEQGNVDTKALLGHLTERMSALYADPSGIAPIRVKIGGGF
ncbi:phage integrase Arm DNA-binding domain-containing protein [Pandoraea sp. B-6]|uniref:phage integrase Arm DNA-binding domain-containing protein n=1 Tax=Pandoraea sp. B-6 TaxID=1204340 RepID=UPI00036B6261|nr:phage integrase Arm DNA-binding domain-containing protein [Pandoraea sp. B-6]